MSPPVLLIHGGLGERMDAERFWIRPGVLAGLVAAGLEARAPHRDTSPSSWAAAASAIALAMSEPTSVVAGSNGVSVAVRLALDHRPLVARLGLVWPATCGDPLVDRHVPPQAAHLLAGETLRGVGDHELAGLDVPMAVMASDPPNPVHDNRTVERLVALVPRRSACSSPARVAAP